MAITIPQVKDYETVDFRQVERGEEYIVETTIEGPKISRWDSGVKSNCFYWILKPIPAFFDAKPSDFAGFPRDCLCSLNGNHWVKGVLCGVKIAPDLSFWVQFGSGGVYYWTKYCRVEDKRRP